MAKCNVCGYETNAAVCPACGTRTVRPVAQELTQTQVILNNLHAIDNQTLLNVAVGLYRGVGIEKNPAAAEHILNVLAMRGDTTAMIYLSQILKGKFPPQKEQALGWLELATQRGDPNAAQLLAKEYGITNHLKTQNSALKETETSLDKLVEESLPAVMQIFADHGDGRMATGAGFILKGGLVISNNHVVEGEPERIVGLFDPKIDGNPYGNL